jgi:hypothetical protein
MLNVQMSWVIDFLVYDYIQPILFEVLWYFLFILFDR